MATSKRTSKTFVEISSLKLVKVQPPALQRNVTPQNGVTLHQFEVTLHHKSKLSYTIPDMSKNGSNAASNFALDLNCILQI